MNPLLVIGCGWCCMVLVMSVLWLVQKQRGDAGIVDVAWGLGVGCLGVLFAVMSFDGDQTRRFVVGAMVLLWALRLSLHIALRLMRLPEDGRYQTLKGEWGIHAQRNLFFFFQLQAFWSVLFAMPILLSARNPLPFGGVADFIGLGIWLLALGGEALADRQLSTFRQDLANKGQVCRAGLWRYSRHPNYFFEWLHWWAYVCLAIGADWGWLSVGGPVCMLYFLLKVTGVPPTEAQALKSRGDAYREYQRTTSVFFPWPPKQGVDL